MSLAEIAKKLHVSLSTLKSKIKELGLTRQPRYRKKAINVASFKKSVKMGMPNVKIARKFHLAPSTVIKLKKEYGLAIQDPERISYGKKGAACRTYYKQTGIRPECPTITNILEQYQDTVIPMLENGTPKTEIAKKYGVCISTVYNFIHLYGITAPVRKICDHKEQLITEAFDSGESLEDISQKLNCHAGTIYRKLKDMKLERSQDIIKRKSLLNNQEDKIKNLYNQGVSGPEIARQLGVSYQSVYDFIHRKQFDASQRQVKYCSTFNGHDQELLSMRQKGMTLKQIGDYFGVKSNTVFYRLQKLANMNRGYQNV